MPRVAFSYLDKNSFTGIINEIERSKLLSHDSNLIRVILVDNGLHRNDSSRPGIVFRKWQEAVNPVDYPSGRLFGPSGELRWHTRLNLIHTILITDNDGEAFPESFNGVLTIEEGEENAFRLWRNEYRRLPFGLPDTLASDSTSYSLLVETIYKSESGEIAFVRYKDLSQ
jgi:hypothetical protein